MTSRDPRSAAPVAEKAGPMLPAASVLHIARVQHLLHELRGGRLPVCSRNADDRAAAHLESQFEFADHRDSAPDEILHQRHGRIDARAEHGQREMGSSQRRVSAARPAMHRDAVLSERDRFFCGACSSSAVSRTVIMAPSSSAGAQRLPRFLPRPARQWIGWRKAHSTKFERGEPEQGEHDRRGSKSAR